MIDSVLVLTRSVLPCVRLLELSEEARESCGYWRGMTLRIAGVVILVDRDASVVLFNDDVYFSGETTFGKYNQIANPSGSHVGVS